MCLRKLCCNLAFEFIYFLLLLFFQIRYFMKTSNKKTKNLATPGKPMSQDEFVSLIKEAEEGRFNTLEESKRIFKEWRAKLEK